MKSYSCPSCDEEPSSFETEPWIKCTICGKVICQHCRFAFDDMCFECFEKEHHDDC